MLRCVFIVECGITRFLCVMRVFKVQASSSSPRLSLCQFFSFAASIAELAHGEKSHTVLKSINHSLTLLIWCPGNQSFHFGILKPSNKIVHSVKSTVLKAPFKNNVNDFAANCVPLNFYIFSVITTDRVIQMYAYLHVLSIFEISFMKYPVEVVALAVWQPTCLPVKQVGGTVSQLLCHRST